MDLTGRTVAITGAASGIGAALARESAARGAAAIAVIDIDEQAATRVARELSSGGTAATAYHCDIADPAAVEQVAARVTGDLGLPGLVCANAGVSTDFAFLMNETPSQLNWALSVNVVGTWATLRAFGARMVAADEPGWLLITASEHALGVPYAGNGSYTISKHAVLGMGDVLRHELPAHVGVSVVVPGLASTGLSLSPTRRQPSFGGPAAESPLSKKLLTMGMDPAVVAGAALDGVQSEHFLIATHAHSQRYWQRRRADVDRAFEALADSDIGDRSYDIGELSAQLRQDRHQA